MKPQINNIIWFSNSPEHMCGCGTICEIAKTIVTVNVPNMLSDDEYEYIHFDNDSHKSRCGKYERENWEFDAREKMNGIYEQFR